MRSNRPYIGDPTPCPGDPSISRGLALRKAICYASDREEVSIVIHRGNFTIAHWPIPQKLDGWCNPNIIKYNFDMDDAREYMAKANFPWPTDPDYPIGKFIGWFFLILVLPITVVLMFPYISI